jgi:hypothetical protein
VALNWTDFIVIAVLVAAGCGLSYAGLWFALRTSGTERQQTTDLQLNAMAAELEALQARVAELGKAPEAAALVETAAAPAALKPAERRENEEVTPETLVVIAAAVTAFLGKKVRIRSAKLLRPPREVANSWAQQGRILIHASHSPRLKG